MADRLERSNQNRVLFGVCGGLAEYFKTDPNLIRLVALLLFLTNFWLTTVLYLALALILPEAGHPPAGGSEGRQSEPIQDRIQTAAEEFRQAVKAKTGSGHIRRNGSVVFGLVLILVGAAFLADQFLPSIHIARLVWPILLIILGLILIKPKRV